MSTYDTTIELICSGEEVELKAEVHFDYEPEQPEIIHPVDISQEGIPASATIYAVFVDPPIDSQPVDIYYLLTDTMLENLEEDILNYKQVQGDY